MLIWLTFILCSARNSETCSSYLCGLCLGEVLRGLLGLLRLELLLLLADLAGLLVLPRLDGVGAGLLLRHLLVLVGLDES